MGERERESVSESARRRRSNRDIYTTGRIHWISDRNFCRALTRDRWQFVENLSYPSAPLFAPRVLEIIHRVIIRAKSWTKGRKNANEIRSFPMKIRQGRSVLPFPSLPFQRSNFCFTQLVYTGRENISLLPEGTEVQASGQTLERTSLGGNGEHAWNYVNFASCQTRCTTMQLVVICRQHWIVFWLTPRFFPRTRIRRKFHP